MHEVNPYSSVGCLSVHRSAGARARIVGRAVPAKANVKSDLILKDPRVRLPPTLALRREERRPSAVERVSS